MIRILHEKPVRPITLDQRVDDIPEGTLFRASLYVDSDPRVFLRAYKVAVDLASPGDTYSEDTLLHNVFALEGELRVWPKA